MGGMVAIVPIRSFAGGKTRLASALSPGARTIVVQQMLRRVLSALVQARVCETIAVLSPDPAVLAYASGLASPVVALPQHRATEGLVAALDAGRDFALQRRADALLVLFGDLPYLTALDVKNIARRDAPIVIAPDRHATGTNGLMLRFPVGGRAGTATYTFRFGANSYAAHLAEADRLGLEAVPVTSPGTGFDLDTPADLRALSPSFDSTDDDLTLGAVPSLGGIFGERQIVAMP